MPSTQVIFDAIKSVNSTLTLVAFAIAALLVACLGWLKSTEKREKALLDSNNKAAWDIIARKYHIPSDQLREQSQRELLARQISERLHTKLLAYKVIIVIALIVAVVAIASMLFGSGSPKPSKVVGSLETLVTGVNSSPSDFTVSLSDPRLAHFWFDEIAAPNMHEAIQKICDANPCLDCNPRYVNSSRHVTIGVKSDKSLREFHDSYGATWQRC